MHVAVPVLAVFGFGVLVVAFVALIAGLDELAQDDVFEPGGVVRDMPELLR